VPGATLRICVNTGGGPGCQFPEYDGTVRHRELRGLLAKARVRYAAVRPSPEVAAFEARLWITLPDDYRHFLTEIGDGGGPSPDGRLLSLAEAEAASAPAPDLAEDFVPPRSIDDDIGPTPPGLLVITDAGSGYKSGLVLGGDERGQIWTYVEVGPGWIPAGDDLVNEDGTPFRSDDVFAHYRTALAPWNLPRRKTFLSWFKEFLEKSAPP